METIELRVLLGFILISVLMTIGARASYAQYNANENFCYNKAYKSDFEAPATEQKFKVVRGKLKRTIKQCSSLYCVLELTPRSRKRLLVVYKRRGKGYVTFGNLGWADKNIAVIRKDQLANALDVASGVELSNIGTDLEAGDKRFHDKLAWEHRCLRRRGEPVDSFNEIVVLP